MITKTTKKKLWKNKHTNKGAKSQYTKTKTFNPVTINNTKRPFYKKNQLNNKPSTFFIQKLKKPKLFRFNDFNLFNQCGQLYYKWKKQRNILYCATQKRKKNNIFYKKNWTVDFNKRLIKKWFSNNEYFIVSKLKNNKIILQKWFRYKKKQTFTKFQKTILSLVWEKKTKQLKNKVFVRRKSRQKRYFEVLFRPYKKRDFILTKINSRRSFLSKLPLFSLVTRELSKTLLQRYNLAEKTIKFWSLKRYYNETKLEKTQTKIFAFLMQRRNRKIGFGNWEKYTNSWLKFALLKNKTIRFYFNPIRIKKLLVRKKLKYLKLYRRLNTLHPRTGKWSTIGLIGNAFARNTAFLKIKTISHILKFFYSKTTAQLIKTKRKTGNRKYSKYFQTIVYTLNFFEQRLDIILFRTGFVIDITLSRLLINRGYFQQNFVCRRNPQLRINLGDLFTILQIERNILHETLDNRSENVTYETFHKLFLNRFYKQPKKTTFYLYFSTIINSLTQMVGKPFWIKNFGIIWSIIDKYKNWVPTVSTKELYELQLNFLLHSKTQSSKNAASKKKIMNWMWYKQHEKMQNNKKIRFALKKFVKTNLFKKNYLQKFMKLNKQTNTKQSKKMLTFLRNTTKDIITQTGEKYVNNLFLNFKYRFAFLTNINNNVRQFKSEIKENNGRVRFFQFRWFINFTE